MESKFLTTSSILLLLIAFLPAYALVPNYRVGIDGWGTHFPVLMTAVANTHGPILELGCGDYSTPMLHAFCAPTKRLLVSAETSEQWLRCFKDLKRDWHQFIYVPVYSDDHLDPNPEAWDEVGGSIRWSVVFIDHGPIERRKIDIQRLRNNTDIFVVHDTENSLFAQEEVLKTFKYRYVYDRYHVVTTVVSDTIDVAQFFKL